ncbi:Phenoxybenzoate dioxygenase subunit beta [compost metagenome]
MQVAPGVALLDALIDAGLNPDYSCREGVCGACELKVISGDVDHRDLILSKQEQAANRSMMI